ncbi:MAG: twin-arginine translocase TatA/TatE family subunit [Acidobacteriia bacterium]|nr:twin-arginine translocase TatA/TatE family subunit [Terriglobia bacterium]
MNFGFSGEMFFIFFLALILFGPKKMPEIGRQVARFINEFRRASNEFRSQIESEINSLETSAGLPRQQILPPLQAPLGSLANRIFNPPSAEKRQAAESAAADTAAVASATVERVAAETTAAVETGLAPSPAPAPKVAPDA